MNTGAKWGIGLGVGIPGVLILIGIIGLLIKFFMKRFRKKAWDDIHSLPKHIESSGNSTTPKPPTRTTSEREPLYASATSHTFEASDAHISIPIDENVSPPGQSGPDGTKQSDHTLVQIQRDRLNRVKEEENRLRPMVHLTPGEDTVQRTIDQAQKDFEDSVSNASTKIKH